MAPISKQILRFSALRRQLAIKVQQVGVYETLKLAPLKLMGKLAGMARCGRQEQHPFDTKYGTDTSGIVELGLLDISDERLRHAVRYQTAIVEVFQAMISDLPIVHENYVFIDLGSGKGRALLLASRLPFKEIVGVELSPTLHAVACSNIRQYQAEDQRCRCLRSVCADAGRFELPPENLVIYMFNPFDNQVMREVTANVVKSLLAKPRHIWVLYLKPDYRELWDTVASLAAYKQTANYVIWRTAPIAS